MEKCTSCLIFPKFTIYIDKKLSVFQGKLVSISQSFYPNVAPNSSVEGQILILND